MSDDLNFSIVAGVHMVAPAGKSTAPGTYRRDLLTHGERAWEVLPENDQTGDADIWRHSGESINELLYNHLRDLQDRASDEAVSNPVVEGVLAKHRVDVVGEEGPTLQIEPIDWDSPARGEEYAAAAERLFAEVAESPTADGEMTLAEWLGVGLESDWTKGGSFDQLVYDTDVDHPIKTRLFPIEIERLETPTAMSGDADTLLGITRNRFGRPIKYWIADQLSFGGLRTKLGSYKPIDARRALHCYHKRFTGQVRGVPRLAAALAAMKELRQYDMSVMDLAQTAAMMGVLIYTTSEMVDAPENMAEELKTPLKVNRKGITRLPYHHQAQILSTNNPPPSYIDFRHERSRDVGRPMAMPQLAVQMDASGHNYSSARFDDQGYRRANECLQSMFGKKRLTPFAHRVLREAEGLRLIPRRAGKIKFIWQWPKLDGIDPVKDAMSRKLRLNNLSTSPLRVAREESNDFEQICREWSRAIEILKKYDLPLNIAGLQLDPDIIAAIANPGG